MGRIIPQIIVNAETHKCIYLIKQEGDLVTYQVSTDMKDVQIDKAIPEGDNISLGNFFFHKSYLELIKDN